MEFEERDVLLIVFSIYNYYESEMFCFLDGYVFILLLLKWLIYGWFLGVNFSVCLWNMFYENINLLL